MASSTTRVEPTPDENAPENDTTTGGVDAATTATPNETAPTVPIDSEAEAAAPAAATTPEPAPEAAAPTTPEPQAPSGRHGLSALRGGKLVAAIAIGALAVALLFGGGFATGFGAKHLFGGDRGHASVGNARPGPGFEGGMRGQGGFGPGNGPGDRGGDGRGDGRGFSGERGVAPGETDESTDDGTTETPAPTEGESLGTPMPGTCTSGRPGIQAAKLTLQARELFDVE